MSKKLKRITEDEEDRLSALPEGVLLHILSFLDTKGAVQTSVVSKMWRTLWTIVPDIDLDCASFKALPPFDNFVKQVLALRDNSVMINTFKFKRKGVTDSRLLNKAANYAVSHGVQHLKMFIGRGRRSVPSCLYLAESLTTFELKTNGHLSEPLYPLGFKKLTRLHLECILFKTPDVFSGCPNLTELALINCKCSFNTFKIHAPRLVRLTIWTEHWRFSCKVALFAPELVSFNFKGGYPLTLLTDELVLLQTLSVEIAPYNKGRVNKNDEEQAHLVKNLLQSFDNAKHVALSMTTIERLSTIADSIAQQPVLFRDLKSLKIIAPQPESKKKTTASNIPPGVMNYLLGHSPSAQVVFELVPS